MVKSLDHSGEDMFVVEGKSFPSVGGGHGNLFLFLLSQVIRINASELNIYIILYSVSSGLPIAEGLETIVQENSYSNSTGILGKDSYRQKLSIK